ncbi:S9 family peptidase [Terrimonas sp. NA20]|uniref:S9 family peptidase n=1 Tax=Terrimonas ginsenosidimutans TaxID=2908004 RepID=A0ABS9KK01_9BACT|nr:DPP IV N-terminal domain-containing protein [Terrimonas ginsenosidimutans]MCG2612650.1 S9 family peptidase [Terrimonas ginsenosidimutans]
MPKRLITLAALAASLATTAQRTDSLSRQDYENAAKFLGFGTENLVFRNGMRPTWIEGSDKFWYAVNTEKGTEFFLVDAAKKAKQPAFDQAKLAAALSKQTSRNYDPYKLPFQTIAYSTDGKSIAFSADSKKWNYDLKTGSITEAGTAANEAGGQQMGMGGGRRGFGGLESTSPDGKKAVFIKNYNLWIRDVATKEEKQLTTDGVKDFGYATDNAGWASSERAILKWSPDSKKISTFQQDERKVGDMYLATTNVGHPTLRAWKYPLPGDKEVAMLHRVIIDLETGKVIRLQIPPDFHRSSISDNITDGGSLADIDWKADGTEMAFLSTSRDHKISKMRIANAATGAVREVFEETVPTQYESGRGGVNWRYLPATNEFIWYSQRDNWGHLYLYDATTGQVKNQITKGEFVVSRIVEVDEKKREITFTTTGNDPVNPYYSNLYRVSFDGKKLVALTSGTGTHSASFSPSKKFIIDTYSQPNVPAVTVLRDANGKQLIELEKTDISKLEATGWKAPTPVKVKAHDGKTDIYGLVFTPTKMDASKKYPVVNYIYPGPQGGSVGNWSFSTARSDHQALAELGFIIVLIEGTSNPNRSKSYHDMSYGNMAENTIPDQITAIRQLSQTYPMDTTKVGMWGHSGGGFATATAMFRYPDFYKVGISESGNHDNRNYEDDWGERYNGLAENVNYGAQANQNYAQNLKGKLMLAHGLMDNNVPPYNTLLVVEALQKANKDFDLVIFPNSAHGFGQYSYYMMRRRWDYFVKHLRGIEPPKEFELRAPTAGR